MTKNAVLVFLPMSGIGDFLPMVNVAKRLMDLNSNLFTAVLFMDEDEGLNQTVSAEFDSVSGRTKFINLPPPPLVDHKDTPLVERAVNLAKAMKPSIIEAVTNIVRDSTSPQLAGFVLDKFYTPLTNDLANEFRVPTYLFYTSNAAALGMDLYMQALHDDDDQKLNLAELQDSEIDEFNRLSSLPPIPYEFFPPALQNLDIFHSIHIHRMKNHSKEVKGTAESEIDEFNRLSSLPPIPYELFPSSLLNLDIFRKIHIHRMNNHSKEVKGTTESEITFNIKEVKGKAESEIEPYSLSPTPYDFSPPVLQNLENFHKIHRMKNHSKEVKGKAESEIEFNISVGPVPHNILQNLETFDKIDRIKNPLKEVKGIMVNTFLELETNTVNSLSDGKLPPVYPVGPILNLKSSSEVDQKYADIMEWLDGQPASSVVLFCFGSMGSFNEDQVKEIACGLEQSGHRFLWSLRRPPVEDAILRLAGPTDYEDVASVLPEGFLDRTLGIGKIIGWAPQVTILDHPAIGGFVSNCGWNSVLESIWFGVPTATWPIYAEQYMNAFQIVKELGIGVEITMDYRKEVWPMGGDHKEPEIVNAIKIERGIRRLMEQNTEVRKRVKEMSDKSRKVLMEGGSSYSNLCRFINDVMDNMP